MRTYRTAHALAAQGHDVHVVTNAKEAQPPFRMHMRAEDWRWCETKQDAGSVTVHWTDPVDRSQSYLPMASPFVSKLAAIAARVHSMHPFDVIFSHYMEPYGIAGYLASQMTGLPHVVRMAGSDAGRLWHHPQLEALYDHVLRSAERVVAVGAVADRAAQRGVDPGRIASGGSYILPEEAFTPEGPAIDFGLLRNEIEQEAGLRDLLWGGFAGDKPHFGIYGKLGDNKGSFALLAAMHRLKLDGLHLGLVALAHGRPAVEQRFRERAHELGLTDRILQIPFIPHWRVPEFLRGCLAVCCLEQDFPIGFHSPIIPLEVLLCGRCLVASTEVIRKLPQWDRLPHGYGCVAVNDVNDAEELSGKLAAIVRKPELAAVVGARGRIFARDCQQGLDFPARLERVLEAAARRIAPYAASSLAMSDETEPESGGFPLTRIAAAAIVSIAQEPRQTRDRDSHDLAYARHVLAEIESAVVGGKTELQSLALAVEVEIAIARAGIEAEALDGTPADPLFRIDAGEWAMDEKALGHLRPVRDSRVRILRFDYDITPFLKVETLSDFPASVEAGPSYIAVFGNGTPKEPLLIDRFTARILELSDGTRTASEIVGQLDREFGRTESIDHLAWIENLLLSGLIGVRSSKACVFHQAV